MCPSKQAPHRSAMEKTMASSSSRVLLCSGSVAAAVVVLPLLMSAAAVATTTAATERSSGRQSSGCTTHCGDIAIEYPFGVEPGCYLEGFRLACRDGGQLFLGGSGGTVPVLGISIPNATVRVNHTGVHVDVPDGGANATWSIGGQGGRDAGGVAGGPYFLSNEANSLVAMGCDVHVDLRREDDYCVSACTPICPENDPDSFVIGDGHCNGVGCCRANIFFGRASFGLELGRTTDRPSSRRPAAHWNGTFRVDVFLVDSEYEIDSLSSPELLPAVLGWMINGSACHGNRSSPFCRSSHSHCRNSSDYSITDNLYPYHGHTCHCSDGYQGNPYILDGCHDINECDSPDTHKCYGVCTNTPGAYRCQCPDGYVGNASKLDGCEDIDECAHPASHSCFGLCINLPGTFHCRCGNGTHGDPFIKGGCITINHSPTGVTIALALSGGSVLLLLALLAPMMLRKIKQRRVQKLKEKYFKQNHGLLLQQLVSQKVDIGERMIITLRDIEKATGHFDRTRKVGGGGHGIVYKGILDLQVVAIKKSKIVVQREINEFINEVSILSQVNHKNVVKLIGCCLETEVPLLVYEFISNGTLDHHLHVEEPMSLSWDARIRIALEVARAISYLHSAASTPIYHRDIKSSNILLDDNLTAKVSDFGASRYIPIDQSELTTAVQGTYGYLDPMYYSLRSILIVAESDVSRHILVLDTSISVTINMDRREYYTGRLTDKSDVFSFGVLLMELLTRRKPSAYRSGDGVGLVSHFASLLREGNLIEIIDPQVMEGDGEVQEIIALATACTKLKGEDRPTMREVEMTLENLRATMRRYDAPCDTSTSRRCNGDPTMAHSMSNEGVTKEGSRQYTMEVEMLMSARYPR